MEDILTKTRCTPGTKCCPTLFNICVDYIASSLHLLDSLVDFPDIVAEQLFASVTQKRLLDHPSIETCRTLGIFSEAYESELLSSVNFGGLHLVLDQYEMEINTFKHLMKLNLTGTPLGEDHHIFKFIGGLRSLHELHLGYTDMADTSLQVMTSPLRIMKQGPEHLGVLNLEGNSEISDRSVRFVACFSKLSSLNLTRTSFTKSGVKTLLEKSELKQTQTDQFSTRDDVGNTGWAADLVNKWISLCERRNQDIHPKHTNISDGAKKSFYSSIKTKMANKESVQRNHAQNLNTGTENAPILQFHRDTTETGHTGILTDNTGVINLSRRQIPNTDTTKLKKDIPTSIPQTCVPHENDEDMDDLLNSYTSCVSSKKKAKSLFEVMDW